MTKVVINRCFGGFGLSNQGFERYLELKGIAYESQPARFAWREDGKDYYEAGHLGDDAHYLWDRSIDRDTPELIQTIEELGSKVNGWCADLRIVEIPDDVEWEIVENDGSEWVAEKHRKWY